MFTGIIEEVGHVVSIRHAGPSLRLTIEGKKIFEDMEIGCSIAVNGVCLTVTEFTGTQFTADVMPESVKMTTLYHLKTGTAVNLERAMAANGRFGGHMVAGHVDGTGVIRRIQRVGNSVVFSIATSPAVMDYIIYKGSIAVDGASLTVSKREADYFEISIIPHTIENTILASAKVGTVVNLETDIAGRYIQHFLIHNQGVPIGADTKAPVEGEPSNKKSKMTMDWLSSKGFM
ncbi:riboflavin synthase [uncultured Veillonella sp.]|uniref:riboflavin synthase n=1 Tax=uncultured Veillonella sp. TaxID=159268 RepID=UPI0025CE1386|nr:riboflavin synthase [uncultured Veillonella sp.]MDY3974719.1 riboflavin synthase [Veillonella caviae]